MDDVLAGSNAVWDFETDAIRIRYERGVRQSRLLQTLGERRIPHTALQGVELRPGRRGTVVLRALPRPGADPLIEAADGQLQESADPYRLVLPAERETLATYHADALRAVITPGAGPAERFLVDAPDAPPSFKAYDAKVAFDGRAVSFRWFWTGASSAKWKAGDQTFPVVDLSGVDWRSPELARGHLRLMRAGGEPGPSDPDQDPASVMFKVGYGLVHESLPFAASVLSAVQRAAHIRPA